ncbi:GNAT family N-acetyltransferase [Brevibacterium oceani]|uniref:GNAT family N-acetyltransferase n=1 Tax=Brevibacterium oceani TaxID=358099 RepID=UPI0015E7D4B2|nr:GNAT family N-acetyltransferase [Brevibacterium oceani]
MSEANGPSLADDQHSAPPVGQDSAPPADDVSVDVVWGLPAGLGPYWEAVPSSPGVSGVLPPRSEVEELYRAAAAEPPLNEDPEYAKLFADVYDVSVRNGQVLMALTRARTDGRLTSFAYGHYWKWEEQKYPWAFELQSSLGESSLDLESTFALNLLARDPNHRNRGIGRRTLETWLQEVVGYGCWLQTDDIDSSARRLYSSLGFTDLGHGPKAPNGRPGLVMHRPAR